MSLWEDFRELDEFQLKMNEINDIKEVKVIISYRRAITNKYKESVDCRYLEDDNRKAFFDIKTMIAKRRLAELIYEKYQDQSSYYEMNE